MNLFGISTNRKFVLDKSRKQFMITIVHFLARNLIPGCVGGDLMPDPHSPAAQTGDPFNGWKRKTSIFLSSQIISLFGSSLVQYAIIWHITLTTQSGLSLTISTLAGFLPQMVISLIAGVWADRFNRIS